MPLLVYVAQLAFYECHLILKRPLHENRVFQFKLCFFVVVWHPYSLNALDTPSLHLRLIDLVWLLPLRYDLLKLIDFLFHFTLNQLLSDRIFRWLTAPGLGADHIYIIDLARPNCIVHA